ncbi:MAG: VCBS repeat-containing protein, partial [Oscillospiraceae bacterium]
MKKSFFSVLFLTACLFALSGCYFRTADELYSLPTPSDIYVNLQSKINEVKGSAEYIAPQVGSNTQTIQLVDLNNDNHQEAIAFFRDPTAEKPLKICVFYQGRSGEYELFAKIEGAATEIESIDYRDLTGTSDFEIIVSWKVGTGIHTLVAYSVSVNQVDEVMRSGYTSYLSADLNQDKKD